MKKGKLNNNQSTKSKSSWSSGSPVQNLLKEQGSPFSKLSKTGFRHAGLQVQIVYVLIAWRGIRRAVRAKRTEAVNYMQTSDQNMLLTQVKQDNKINSWLNPKLSFPAKKYILP